MAHIKAAALEATRQIELKRIAIHIVTMLPHDIAEATIVLDYARELVANFLTPEPPPNSLGAAAVLTLVSSRD